MKYICYICGWTGDNPNKVVLPERIVEHLGNNETSVADKIPEIEVCACPNCGFLLLNEGEA